MENIITILGAIGLIITVPTAVGAGIALVRSSYFKAKLEDSDKHTARLDERIDFLQEENGRLEERVKTLEQDKRTLTEAATQRADLAAHHEEVMHNYEAMAVLMGQILTAIQNLKEAVDAIE